MSAKGLIQQTLSRFGLSSLASWAWKQHLEGTSFEEIMLLMRQQTSYKNRFPAMEELSKRGLAFSEEAYIQYEQTIRNMAVQFGMPLNIYGSRKYIAKLLTNDIAPTEAQRRFQLAAAASFTAPPEWREQAARLYGITSGEWASIWLEPDETLPELERKFAASAIAGQATINDLGQLSRKMSERLADAGVTPEQANEAFARVSREFTVRLPGEADKRLSANTVAAGALGQRGEAARLDRLRRLRIAQFAGGGGYATTSQGSVGLGSANR